MWKNFVTMLRFLIRMESLERERYQAFIDWYRQTKIQQIRYSALLTAALYLLYQLIEMEMGLFSWPRFTFHFLLVPLLLLVISVLSLRPNCHTAMRILLMVAPFWAVIVNPLFNVGQGEFERFSPEIYLAIVWIFTISGLTLRPAFWTALATVACLIGTSVYLELSSQMMQMMLFWILAAFLFGLLGAFVVEQANYTLFIQRTQLLQSANSDGLTGLWNRKMLYQLFNDCTVEPEPDLKALSVIMIDIDFFKQVNDLHGHIIGDKVLRAFADLLRRNVRAEDHVCRIGGEEFCVLLPGASLHQTVYVAGKLRECIGQYDFDPVGYKTASFGVTQHQPGETLSQCMGRADKALYRAKRRGRNRVETEPEIMDETIGKMATP